MRKDAKSLIRDIVDTVGPRPACSPHEQASAEWMAGQFRAAGYETRIAECRSVPTFTVPFALLGAAGFLGYVPWAPYLGFVVSLLLAGEVLTLGSASAALKLFWRSRNAEGFRKASGASRQTVVLTAHIDSAIEAGIKTPRMSRLLVILMIVAPSAIAAGTIGANLGLETVVMEWVRMPAAVFLLACVAILGKQAIVGVAVPGAADNASGMAALALAAKAIPPLANTDIFVVGTGSEEAGLFGMTAFLRQHRLPRGTTWFINLDQLGRGPLTAITTGGMLIPFRSDATLLALAKKAAADAKIDIAFKPFRDMSTDACPCIVRRYRAISLMGSLEHWHQQSDVVENVDPRVAANAGTVAAKMVELLDEE